jgi:4a-hydroxytetrahydrobiopterin dehydratase
MSLAQKHCSPCSKTEPPMPEATSLERLKAFPGWELVEDARSIARVYNFKNWKEAFGFVAVIDGFAEAENHHPDVAFGWGYCDVVLSTHSIDGLHENDFIMAAKIEQAYEQYSG